VLEHKVWDVRPLPEGRSAITPKWVRNEKADHTLKSRSVGRGYSMVPGMDFEATFSPVAKLVTFRIFLTLVASYFLFFTDTRAGCQDCVLEHQDGKRSVNVSTCDFYDTLQEVC
jgi:hypothetical protein